MRNPPDSQPLYDFIQTLAPCWKDKVAAAEDLLYLGYVNPHRKVRAEFEFLKGLHSEALRQSHAWCVKSGHHLYTQQSAHKGVWGACVLLDPPKVTLQKPA